MKEDLEVIANVLTNKSNRIVVRGHATREILPPGFKFPEPNRERFRDPWHLSYARADAVAKYLIAHGIAERRIQLSAAGDSEPRIISRDKDLHRENRRVDVFVVDAYTTSKSGSSPAAP
jgi:chemotaxis protein MotB